MTERRFALVVCLVALMACDRAPSSPSGQNKKAVAGVDKSSKGADPSRAGRDGPSAAVAGDGPHAPLSAGSTAVQAELRGYSQRRKPKRAVIGGCAEACDSPSKTIGLLFDALAASDRPQRLSMLFEWSVLRVDGDDKGNRWASMWGNPTTRTKRQSEIDEWLVNWSRWVERIETKDGLVKTRMSGIKVSPIANRTDVVELSFRHPRLRDDASEPVWRFQLTRRGYEWLVSRIDHRPSERSKTASSPGSPRPGYL